MTVVSIGYCGICHVVHSSMARCAEVQEIQKRDARIRELEAQLEGWRNSDTARLIEERDEARKALTEARRELGRRRPIVLDMVREINRREEFEAAQRRHPSQLNAEDFGPTAALFEAVPDGQ